MFGLTFFFFFVFALPTLSPAHCSKRRAVTACDFTQRGSEAPWKLLTVKKKGERKGLNHSPSRVKKKRKATDQWQPHGAPGNTTCFFCVCLKVFFFKCFFYYFFFLQFFFSKSKDFLLLQTTSESVLYILIPDASVLLPCASFYYNTYPDSGGASKWLAQFAPPPSSPALPLVKLPLGYYRDVFINAVYVPLSALFLSLHLPPHFPHLSSPLSPLKMTSSSFSPSSHLSVCLAAFSFILSLLHVSFPTLPPPPPPPLLFSLSLFC